jgi:hypothetical protein
MEFKGGVHLIQSWMLITLKETSEYPLLTVDSGTSHFLKTTYNRKVHRNKRN